MMNISSNIGYGLVEHARAQGLEYGWRPRRVHWQLMLTTGGEISQVRRLDEVLTVPLVTRTSNIAPRMGVDSTAYVMGKHAEVWRDLMTRMVDAAPRMTPVTRALRAWLNAGAPIDQPPNAKPDDVWAIQVGDTWVHDDPAMQRAWRDHLRDDLDSGTNGVCCCCGDVARLARKAPASIPAAYIGASGYELSLFSGAGAIMCISCVTAQAAALQDLVSQRDSHISDGNGSVVLWWTTQSSHRFPLQDFWYAPSWDKLEEWRDTPGNVHVAIIVGASKRLSLREYRRGSISDTVDRVESWYRAITTSTTKLHSLGSLLGVTGSWDRVLGAYRSRNTVSARLMWHAALDGKITVPIVQHVLRRVRKDRRVSDGRVVLLTPSTPRKSLPPGEVANDSQLFDDGIAHGSLSGWVRAKCRCPQCSQA